jgi:alpha-tubulin suppressor-like RCC1 family protein
VAEDGTAFNWGFGGESNDLNLDGTVGPVNTSYVTYAVPVFELDTTVEEVAAGMEFSLARMQDGTVFGWGRNDAGQLSNGQPAGLTIIWPGQITTDNKLDGTPLGGVAAIAAGNMHSLAVVGGLPGASVSWGNNAFGQLGDGTLVNKTSPVDVLNLAASVLRISAGCGGRGEIIGNHSLALLSDGSVWAWGDNRSGQLGNNSRVNSSLPVRVAGN